MDFLNNTTLKVFFLLEFGLILLPLKITAQIEGDPSWHLVFEDDFTLENRFWNDEWLDSPLEIWRAYAHECGVTHRPYPMVYQRNQCQFVPSESKINLIAEYSEELLTDENCEFPPEWDGSNFNDNLHYRTGKIDTKRKFRYGYFEIRCKLPVHVGAFPAFWLWDAKDSLQSIDPHYEEIDIFEYSWNVTSVGYNPNTPGYGSPRCFTTGIHINDSMSYPHSSIAKNFPIIPDDKPDLSEWNVFSCEWSPDRVIWYFNGTVVNEYYIAENIPHRNLRLKCNYALDDYVFSQQGEVLWTGIDTMFVDYIRAYQMDWSCYTDRIISGQTQLNEFMNNCPVSRSITIGNTNGRCIRVPENTAVAFKAGESIIIGPNFELPRGSQMVVDIRKCPQ